MLETELFGKVRGTLQDSVGYMKNKSTSTADLDRLGARKNQVVLNLMDIFDAEAIWKMIMRN